MASNNEGVDYQLGSHELDTSGSIVEDDEVMEFDFEPGAVFRRLADDIYESPEAGVREPLTNAITTVRRVFGGGDEGVIKVTVQDGDQVMLRLRDNGEGITKSVLEKVLTVIGRSNARDDGKLSGQYGMGFLASYKLVGLDGGFLMCTNPRNTEQGPYSGLFKPGTYEPDKNDSLPQLLDEEEYGTVFEYYVRDDVTISDIRGWVKEHAKWSPVPVIYKELDEDGEEVYNEDYHAGTLTDAYGSKPSLHVENKYYEAATSPNAESDVILISSPVSMRGTRTLRNSLPWSVDLRLKYENGVVFKGPNEGLVPTNDAHYEGMSEERKKKYIRKDDLERDDMQLPEPTGTRERMRKHRDFLKHVNNQLTDKYLTEVEDTLDSFDPGTMSMQDLNSMGKHVMLRIFSKFDKVSKDYTEDEIERKLSRKYNYDNPDDSLLEFIKAMTRSVVLISENKGYDNKYPRKPAYQLTEDEERVFMCVSNNSWKVDAVSKADEPTHVIKVEKADDYDPFEEHLDWTKLKEIKKSNATDALELEQEQLESLTKTRSSKSDDISDRDVTVHYSGGGRSTTNRSAERLVEMFKHGNQGSRLGDVLILFSRTGEHNISDHYDLANMRCSLSSCGKKIRDYLTEGSENIIEYEDYRDWASQSEAITVDGTVPVSDVVWNGSPVVKVVQDLDGLLTDSGVLRTIQDQLQSRKDVSDGSRLVVIEKQDWHHILNNREGSELEDCKLIRGNTSYTGQDKNMNKVRVDLTEVFARGYLDEQVHQTSEFEYIIDRYSSLCKDLLVSCRLLDQVSDDSEAAFASLEDNEDNKVVLPEHQTKDGMMTISQIYEQYEPREVIIHKLSSDEIDKFVDSLFLNQTTDRISGLEIGKHNFPNIPDKSIYVPMIESEYDQIEDHIKSGTTVLGGWSIGNDRYIDIAPKYIYAAVKLNDWSTSQIKKILSSSSFEEGINLVDTVEPVHDKCTLDFESDIEEVVEYV